MQTDSCVFCPFHCPPKEKAYSCLKPSRALFIMFDGWWCSQTLGLRLYGGRPGLMHWPFTFANGSVRFSLLSGSPPAGERESDSLSESPYKCWHTSPKLPPKLPLFPLEESQSRQRGTVRVPEPGGCDLWTTCGSEPSTTGGGGCPVVSAALSVILPRCHSSWPLCRPSWRTPEPSRLPGSPRTLGLQRPPAETPQDARSRGPRARASSHSVLLPSPLRPPPRAG